MKTLFPLLILILALGSCKKEIAGPQGPQGNTGAQGATGLSNQKTHFGNVQIGSWVSATGGIDGNHLYTSTTIFPTYSFAPGPPVNIDSTTFIVYIDVDTTANSHTWALLPYSESGTTINFEASQIDPDFPWLILTKYDGSMPAVPARNFDLKMVVITK